MASPPTPPTRTITETQVKERFRTLIITLTSPTTDSSKINSAEMVAEVQRRVDAIFNELLNTHVYDGQEHINQNLLAAIQKSKDPDAFLEVFLMELYHEAIKKEKESVKSQMSEPERQEMDDLSKKASDDKRKKDGKGMETDHVDSHKKASDDKRKKDGTVTETDHVDSHKKASDDKRKKDGKVTKTDHVDSHKKASDDKRKKDGKVTETDHVYSHKESSV